MYKLFDHILLKEKEIGLMLHKKKVEKDFPKKLNLMKNNIKKNFPTAMEWFVKQATKDWSEDDLK